MSGHRWLDGASGTAQREVRRALDDAHLRGPDDVTLRRMWARIAEVRPAHPWRAPRWLWFASGVACTAALAFTFAAWMWPRASATAVALTHATPAPAPAPVAVTAVRQTADPQVLLGVVAPATVRTAAGETLRMTLHGGVEARLGPSSVLSLDAHDRPSVEGGEVAFAVPHQPPGHAFSVRAGRYRVVVVGTKFRLRLDQRGQSPAVEVVVGVAVEEGVVEVWDRERLAVLSPGQSWQSPPAAEADADAEATPAAARTERVISTPAPVRARTTRQPEPLTRKLALATPGGAGAPPPGASPAEAATAAPSELAAQARAALADGDPARALAVYRGLVQRGGPAGENAEYEIGKVLRDRMAQPVEAVAAWRRYRNEHPDGLLRVEADVSIIETLIHSGADGAALTEAEDFLRRHPDSERRAEIARLAGDLERAGGDCGRAVTSYQTALAAPRAGEIAEPATFHRAACLIEMRDPSAGDAVRAYLRSWPNGRFHVQAAALLAQQARPADRAATAPGSAPRP